MLFSLLLNPFTLIYENNEFFGIIIKFVVFMFSDNYHYVANTWILEKDIL